MRSLGAFVIAVVLWILFGFVATAPLGTIYGWTGHPAVPNAPVAVYIGLYLVALPCACLFAAWKLVGWLEGRAS